MRHEIMPERQSVSPSGSGASPELDFTLPTSSQEPSEIVGRGRGGARDWHGPGGQRRGRNPNVLGQHRGKTTVWNSKTLSILKIKPQQSGRLEGLGHSAKLEMAVVTGLRPRGGKGEPGQGPGQGRG